MKRTITQVIEMIKEKIDNCERNEYALRDAKEMGLLNKTEKEKISVLAGSKQAYMDILALLEDSHLVEQEKVLEIFKKYFSVQKDKVIGLYRDGEDIYYISPKDKRTRMVITKENYELLSEVLKDNE